MDKAKILVVEDEILVGLDIQSTLKKLGFEVTGLVTNYDDTLQSIQNNPPQIIIMDINLENSKDGIETATAVKQLNPNIAIIYLTAFSDDTIIHRAAYTEPIGYLLKPFKSEELKSTIFLAIHKLNKVKREQTEHLKSLGLGYYYDPKSNHLYYEQTRIPLSAKETTLIKLLIDANGEIVSFETIEYNVWPDMPVSNGALRTLLYRLRAKLEHKLIETIQSVGCKVVFFR